MSQHHLRWSWSSWRNSRGQPNLVATQSTPLHHVGASNQLALIFKEWTYWACTCSCNWIFDRLVIILYSLVSRVPYFALIHTILSLPISIFLFAMVMMMLGVGGFLYCICGIGIFLLVVMSGFLRGMTVIEVFLARHLLCMKDTLVYPANVSTFIQTSSSSSHRRKKRKKKKKKRRKKVIAKSSTTKSADHYYRVLNFDVDEDDLRSENKRLSESVNADEDSIILTVNAEDNIDSETDSYTDTDYSTEEETYSSSDPARKIIISPNENQYYYQQYGTMMSRSLDGPSTPPFSHSRATDILHFNSAEHAPPRTPPINAQKQKQKKKKTKKRGKSKESSRNQIQDSQPKSTIYYGSTRLNNSDMGREKNTGPKRKRWNRFASKISAYVFDSSTGFAILYTVVKLPISMLTFIVSVLLLAFPGLLIFAPIIRVTCKQITHENYFCAGILDPSDFHNEWLPLFSWSFWLVNNQIGNVIACVSGCLLLPFCIFLLGPVTKPARDAVALIGDDLAPLDIEEDDE
jgi:hypothetical protein